MFIVTEYAALMKTFHFRLSNKTDGVIDAMTVRKRMELNFTQIGADRRLFVFVALRPKSTAMVIAGQSVHLTTLFPGQA